MTSTDSKWTILQADLDRLIDVCRLLAEHGITPGSVGVTRHRCVTVQLDCQHDVDLVADALGVRRSDGLPSSVYVRGEYDDPVRVYGPAECQWYSRCRFEAVSSMILVTTSHYITVDRDGRMLTISWRALSSALAAVSETCAATVVVRCLDAAPAVRLSVADAERYLAAMESVRAIEAGVSA